MCLLFDTGTPLWRYCVQVFVIAFVPAFVVVGSVILCLYWAQVDFASISAPDADSSLGGAVRSIVLAPVIETALLALLIVILSSLTPCKVRIAMVAGVLSGICHALYGLLRFLGPAWAFFVFSCAYLAWRERSFKHAYLAALVPHMLNNAAVMLGVRFVERV